MDLVHLNKGDYKIIDEYTVEYKGQRYKTVRVEPYTGDVICMDIKFVEHVTCKECAIQFKNAGKKEREELIQQRKNLMKCQGCYRIQNVK